MRWNGIRIPIVIMAVVMGLALLMGLQWTYNRLNYDRPLDEVLENSPFVESYEIEENKYRTNLAVRLKEVENLQESYSALYQSIEKVLGDRKFEIVVRDNRNDKLEKLYHYARLASYEALSRGNYLEMGDSISGMAAREGAVAGIYVDDRWIYIHLKDGDHYLYGIINRVQGVKNAADGAERGQPA